MAYGVGASLASMGLDQKREAMSVLREAADQETTRNIQNKQLEVQEEAGKRQLGSMLGATAGMAVGGPLGAMIGGTIGAIAGGLF